METEIRQVQEGSDWMPTVAWRFCPGDCVFISDDKNGARLGRVDCVRLNWCPEREQAKDPGDDHLWVSFVKLILFNILLKANLPIRSHQKEEARVDPRFTY